MRRVGLGEKLCISAFALLLSSCATTTTTWKPTTVVKVSVHDQALVVMKDGIPTYRFPVSTSRFGLGDQPNSFRTPLGRFVVQNKIGDGVPLGGKFFHRHYTGERIDLKQGSAPGHDSLLTRILWLRGLEEQNRNAYSRGIYIHGTNQESLIGQPVSYGCIRMRNEDVLTLYDNVPLGSLVVIQTEPLSPPSRTLAATAVAPSPAPVTARAAAAPRPAVANATAIYPKALPVSTNPQPRPASAPRQQRRSSSYQKKKPASIAHRSSRRRHSHGGQALRGKHLAKASPRKDS